MGRKRTGLNKERGASFRRPARRIAVRKQVWWRRTLRVVMRGVMFLVPVVLIVAVGWMMFVYAKDGGLFQFNPADAVQVVGARHVDPKAVRERFAGDAGTSLFWLRLAERRAEIEEIAWVRSAAVERLLPNRVRVAITERTPVAFLKQRNTLWLVDGEGVVLPIPESAEYDFPVLTGIPASFSREQRAVRVQLYLDMLSDMDADGGSYSARLSEVDVSDLDDVTATITGPGGAVRAHFGRGRYQEKFMTYLDHRDLWEGRREVVESVDLRYRGQIILNPDRAGVARP